VQFDKEENFLVRKRNSLFLFIIDKFLIEIEHEEVPAFRAAVAQSTVTESLLRVHRAVV